MEDSAIIKLYLDRDENAIKETDAKYNAYCTHIALNLLHIAEDAQECVNDTYLAAWERIPPHIPECLRAFLGRITRNISIERYRSRHAARRAGTEIMLSELEECLPSSENVELSMDARLLAGYINDWLMSLGESDRMIFVRRYWYGDTAKTLAGQTGFSESGMSRRLSSLRAQLRKVLTEKGEML